jgi:hypothetical protein
VERIVVATTGEAPSADLLGLLAQVWGEGLSMRRPVRIIEAPPVDIVAVQPFGERVRERRIGHGWSIMEAAHRAGIPPSNWQLIEQGALPLHVSWAVRMAGAVHADLNSLMARR